jgi:hypothetical protein
MAKSNFSYNFDPSQPITHRHLYVIHKQDPARAVHIRWYANRNRHVEALDRIYPAIEKLFKLSGEMPTIKAICQEAKSDHRTVKKALRDLRFQILMNDLRKVVSGLDLSEQCDKTNTENRSTCKTEREKPLTILPYNSKQAIQRAFDLTTLHSKKCQREWFTDEDGAYREEDYRIYRARLMRDPGKILEFKQRE